MRQDLATLQQRVAQAMKDLRELKNAQPIAGDGWVVYRSITDDAWDINLSNVASGYDRLFKITHVPDDGDTDEGFAQFYYKTDYDAMVNLTFSSSYRDSRDPYSYYMRIFGAGGVGSSFRMKFYVFSPKKGTLQITNSAP